MNFCYTGCCSCRIPFHVYEPGKGQEVGSIVKVWGGLGSEVFTDADRFEVKFPAGADGSTKARLLGMTFMLNQLFFEQQK